MQQAVVAVTTRVGVKGAFDVDLPLDAATLNERLFDIGLWLIDRHIPHHARILWEPYHRQIRVSFPVQLLFASASERRCTDHNPCGQELIGGPLVSSRPISLLRALIRRRCRPSPSRP